MKKTYVLTIEYDEAKVNDDSDLSTAIGITKERLENLASRCVEDMKASEKRGDKSFNSLQATIDLLESGELTGNEILYYITTGYNSMNILARVMMKMNPLAGLMGMMRDAKDEDD